MITLTSGGVRADTSLQQYVGVFEDKRFAQGLYVMELGGRLYASYQDEGGADCMIAEPVSSGMKFVIGRPSEYDSHGSRERAFAAKSFIVITAVPGALVSGRYRLVRIAREPRRSDMISNRKLDARQSCLPNQ